MMRSSFLLIASVGVLIAFSVGSVEAAGRGSGASSFAGSGGPPSFAGSGGPPSFASGPTSGPTFSNGSPPGFSEGNKTGFENGRPPGWDQGEKTGWQKKSTDCATLTNPDCKPPGLNGR
jgi:hypothetical protein